MLFFNIQDDPQLQNGICKQSFIQNDDPLMPQMTAALIEHVAFLRWVQPLNSSKIGGFQK
jgi:hypothetical protein